MQEDCLGWVTIMEKADTDLRTVLKKKNPGMEVRKRIARAIRIGLNYLEEIGIEHSDVKLENFLLQDGVVKIIDFGLVAETSGRIAYRQMGYARKGSKFRNQEALGKLI